MKKQAIFIYDPKENALVQVCDVRDLTPDQFEKYSKTAKESARKILCEQEKRQKRKDEKLQEKFDKLNERIDKLENIICKILGVNKIEDAEELFNSELVAPSETELFVPVENEVEVVKEGEDEHEQD